MRPEVEKVAEGPCALSRLIGDGDRPSKTVTFPGERGAAAGAKVTLWNLTDHESRTARLEAIKYLVDVCKLSELHLAHDPALADEEVKTQLLWRALRDPDEPLRPFASTVNKLRVHLTPDEREALFAAYLEFVDERSPIRRIRSDEELDGLAEALGKGETGEITLSSYDTASLRTIVRELASRCRRLTRRLSSGTSSPIESLGAVGFAADPPDDPAADA